MKALIPEELSLLRTHCIHFCPSSKSSSKMISLLIVLMSVLWRKRTCRCFGRSVPYQSNWTSTVFTFFNRRCFLVWSRPDRLLLLEAVRVTALFPCQGLDSTQHWNHQVACCNPSHPGCPSFASYKRSSGKEDSKVSLAQRSRKPASLHRKGSNMQHQTSCFAEVRWRVATSHIVCEWKGFTSINQSS